MPSVLILWKSLLTAALNTVNELNVAEALRESAPGGADVDEVAKRCRADPEKLGLCLPCHRLILRQR